jgi:cysteine synthase A
VPTWFVCGAGTGGTSASIGRALRAADLPARVCVAEPENTAFARGFLHCVEPRCAPASLIEGVGRRRVEPGCAFDLVDRVIELADRDSIEGCHALAARTGTRYGGSSGLVFVAALALAREMHASGETGSIVAVLGDGGERYRDTIYDAGWLAAQRVAA